MSGLLEKTGQHLSKMMHHLFTPSQDLGDGFVFWREKILRIVLGTGLIIGFPVVVSSATVVLKAGYWWLALSDVVLYGAMVALMFSMKLHYIVRAWLITLTCYVAGVWIITAVGFLSGGPIWLFLFAVLAGILLGVRAAVAAILLNALTLVLLGHWARSGLIAGGQPFFPDARRAFVAGVNYIYINCVVAISLTLVMQALQSAINNEKSARAELHAEVEVRKQAELFLTESEQKYRVLAESITDVIWMMNMQLRFTYISPAARKLLGWTVEELMEMTLDRILTPEAYKTAMRVWTENLPRMETEEDFEPYATLHLDHRHRDGSIIATEVRVALLKGDSGSLPAGILGVTRDISERIREQEEREALQRKLAGMKKMEALGLLAGGVAHDLNNVLSGIVSYPDLLLMDLPLHSPLREPLETIRRSGRKAAEIVQDLLALTRRGVQSMVVLDFNEVIREYLSSPEFKMLANHYGRVKVDADLADDLLPVVGSAVHLKKAVMNLVTNAAEAQPEGGLIRIRTYNLYLEKPLPENDDAPSGDCVAVEVSDEGEGIPQEDLARIFEPFF
ncbi:MAG: PAS domain S-box protein, partial [Desulfosarcinaceae bacterium]